MKNRYHALLGLAALAALMGTASTAEANAKQRKVNPPALPSNGNVVIEPGVSEKQKKRDVRAHKHPSHHKIHFRKHGNTVNRD